MILDAETIKAFSVERTLVDFIRVTPLAHKATPLGLGYGKTRFASPDDAFKVLYLGKTLATGVAETVIRDRFVNRRKRRLTRDEIGTWGVTVVGAATPLTVLDLSVDGLLALGAPSDAATSARSAPRVSPGAMSGGRMPRGRPSAATSPSSQR